MANKEITEYYSVVHHNVNSNGLLDILNNTTAKTVVILSELEWELPGLTNYVLEQYHHKNVNIKVVLGSFDTKTNYETVYWPTFWIYWARQNLKYATVLKFNPQELQYPFITLNNRSHYHRCVFIDEMAKENLIDKGIVTWVKHLNENSNYPYKYFDNRQLLLDDDFKNKLDSFLIPIEYNQSLFHIVTEATHLSTFITEKTVIPTLLKKPYLVLGNKGFNKKLVELGFKLYDEVFDYSFDDIENIHERTELFVKNVHRTLNLNLPDTYRLLESKIEYNYNRVTEIIKDKNNIPDIIKQCVKENDTHHSVYGRYERFLND